MSRTQAVQHAAQSLADGRYISDLRRRVAIPSVSQDPEKRGELYRYLQDVAESLISMGFESQILENDVPDGGPFLVARYVESASLPTVLCYGHGDVVAGLDSQWTSGRNPWELRQEGERLYGRGTADNKGQHTLVLHALASVMQFREGRVGFNVTFLIDVGEEVGSLGLYEFCRKNAHDLLKADLLIGSDGPRLSIDQPTLYLGTRGVYNFSLVCDLRDGAHHSGNWGGLIANPAVLLSHAVASLVDREGRIAVRGVLPEAIPENVQRALASCRIDAGSKGPVIDEWWGEPGLSPAERALGWNALEILTLSAGVQDKPVNAIPGKAVAHCQIRHTVDRDTSEFLAALQRHMERHGHRHIRVEETRGGHLSRATRLDPDHPAAVWARDSLQKTLGRAVAVVPNGGGTLPNACFALDMGMPTLWVSHSYTGCGQHGGDEHVLLPLIDDGLRMMAGLFWDLKDFFVCDKRA